MRRKNFYGYTMTALYDTWPPYCMIGKNGSIAGGIFHDILEELSHELNFTTK